MAKHYGGSHGAAVTSRELHTNKVKVKSSGVKVRHRVSACREGMVK